MTKRIQVRPIGDSNPENIVSIFPSELEHYQARGYVERGGESFVPDLVEPKDDDRAQRIRAAIKECARQVQDGEAELSTNYTASNKPRTEVLEALAGITNITASERDATLATMETVKNG